MPLNAVDGGTGGVQGAWNGSTQGIGGGGCSGSLNVNAPVNAGYVGSGNDTGHAGGNCEPGVNTDGTYNLQFINDFIRNGMKQQILFSKAVATTYYGTKPGLQLLERLLDRRAAGLRARAGAAGASSTASSPMRRRSTGRASRPRRCGARS